MASIGLLIVGGAFASPKESRLAAHLFAWPAAALIIAAAFGLVFLTAQQVEALSSIVSGFTP